LTVRDFEVRHTKDLKRPKSDFLKRQKKAKNASKKTPKNRVQNRPKNPKSPIKQGSNADAFIEKTITTSLPTTCATKDLCTSL